MPVLATLLRSLSTAPSIAAAPRASRVPTRDVSARRAVALFAATLGFAGVIASSAIAADVTWNNGSANSVWDTSSVNWSGTAWNNAAGDGAIFDATGAGAISLPGSIFVNSLRFKANAYALNGAGSLTLVNGTSTETTAVFNVDTAVSTAINVPINSSVGFQKIGAGTLTLSAPSVITGNIGLTTKDPVKVDMIVGGTSAPNVSGTLKLASSNVLPTTTRVGIGNGYLDIGSNNVTLGSISFTNQVPSQAWNTTLNANNGVIGTGTLRVLGDITVNGQTTNAASNTIGTNVDLGGGTQIVRVGALSSFAANAALMFTGTLSNGSLLKTVGYSVNGLLGATAA